MDELNHNFGQLSTSAAEWKPAAAASTTAAVTSSSAVDGSPADSDLKAGAVKEFVPGQGWVVAEQQQGETTRRFRCCLLSTLFD